MKAIYGALVAVLVLALFGCGGGGGGSDAPAVVETAVTPEVQNSVPVSNAGPDQNVVLGSVVILDGSVSTDAEGDLIQYEWVITAQPDIDIINLSDSTIVNPTFTADLEGEYVFDLHVYDLYNGTDSTIDTVVITSSYYNSAPVANAGSDQNIATGDTVFLDGSGSSDANGDLLTYDWYFANAPPCSTSALSGEDTVNPQFVADCEGVFTVNLAVHDGTTGSYADTVLITVTTANSAPVSSAGNDQTVTVGDSVQLVGSDSSDADSDPLTYFWTFSSMPLGSTASLSNVSVVNPTFTPDIDGAYVLSLVVDDGTVASEADSVLITVNADTYPVPDAGPDQTVYQGSTVILDGSGSYDADGDSIGYEWNFVSKPGSGSEQIQNKFEVDGSFPTDQVGTYVMSLTVYSQGTPHITDNVSITVEPLPPVSVMFSSNAGIVADLCMLNGNFGISGTTYYFQDCNMYAYQGTSTYVVITNNYPSFPGAEVVGITLSSPGSAPVYYPVIGTPIPFGEPGGIFVNDVPQMLTLDLIQDSQLNGATVTVDFGNGEEESAEWKLSFGN